MTVLNWTPKEVAINNIFIPQACMLIIGYEVHLCSILG